MTDQQIIVFSLITIILGLFVFSKVRYDIVSILALLAGIITGIIDVKGAFFGFSHPATITVALVLILSHTLEKSGATEGISRLVYPASKYVVTHVMALSLIAAILSMFMNNVGALALLMPVVLQTAKKSETSPSLLLMPVAFASMLGGITTLIGTPPNIIISSIRQDLIGKPYHLFDFAPAGGIVAIVGIIFISVFGWRLIKKRDKASDIMFDIESYFTEVKVPKESKLVGLLPDKIDEDNKTLNIMIVSLIRKKQRYYTMPKTQPIQKSDILLVEGGQEDIDKFITKYSLRIMTSSSPKEMLHSKDSETIEVVVGPMSPLANKQVEQIPFKRRHSINLLAVYREGMVKRGRLHKFKVQVGDVLLIYGEKERLVDTVNEIGCLPLQERGIDFGRRKNAKKALGLFILAIVAAIFGAPIHIAFLVAIVMMVLLNILPTKEIYNGIDWPVIILLGAMLPIGKAFDETGATGLIANTFINYTQGMPVYIILGLVLLVTMTLSDLLNNATTAILMAPIAAKIATQSGYNLDPFLMLVAIGASCAFLTPIGHQNNALVMGPGGYKFGDFWRVGLPMELFILITAVPAVMFAWPV